MLLSRPLSWALVVAHAAALDFTVIGDWGGIPFWPYHTPGEKSTATALGEVAGNVNSSFTLALGDNFYVTGVKSVDDPRFHTTFESVYTSPHLQGPRHFRVLAGNHDHNGNVTAQIAYSSRSPRWSFPDLYYDFIERSADGVTAHFVMIDTVVLAGQSQLDGVDGREGVSLKGNELAGTEMPERAEAQWQWINRTLAHSQSDFLIVAGHYPVWSICEHGPTTQLVSRLKPMLDANRVSAYLAGHDHCAQAFQDGAVAYHGIGASNICDPSTAHKDAVPANVFRWHYDTGPLGVLKGAFAHFHLSKTGLVAHHYASSGKLLYTAPVQPPRR